MQWPPVSVDANDDTFCLALSLGLGQKEGLRLNEGLRFRRMLDVLPPHHLHLLLADSITDIPSRRSKRSRSRTKTLPGGLHRLHNQLRITSWLWHCHWHRHACHWHWLWPLLTATPTKLHLWDLSSPLRDQLIPIAQDCVVKAHVRRGLIKCRGRGRHCIQSWTQKDSGYQ